jgi:recombination protein RecA
MALASSQIRTQIEASFAGRIPSVLTPRPRIIRPVVATGIGCVDELLRGGLPVGAITELLGQECSGRSSLALSLIAQMTQAGSVCAWVDVTDSLHPESAAAAGVDLERLLWIRCRAASTGQHIPPRNQFALSEKYFTTPQIKKGLHGGGHGPHPRSEVKGMPNAVSELLHGDAIVHRCAEVQPRVQQARTIVPEYWPQITRLRNTTSSARKPWERVEKALRVTDLLLQGGGFRAIVLDLGSVAPEYASRIPLATWFRYRAAADRTQCSIVLLTQHLCSKSSAGLVLRIQAESTLQRDATVFGGMQYIVEVARERFAPVPTNVIPLRQPPQSERTARWQGQTAWAGRA